MSRCLTCLYACFRCNHSCKRKNQCRHLWYAIVIINHVKYTDQKPRSCRDGLPNPPKKAASAVSSEPSKSSRKPPTAISDGGLKHLEALHKQSGGLDLPNGRQLRLDSARLGVTKAMERDIPKTSRSTVPCEPDEGTEDESESLPDPHEILRRPISKMRQEQETEDLSSDLETDKHGSLKLELEDLQPQVRHVSTSPLKSRRRLRTMSFEESSPSTPATKRQRISTPQLSVTTLGLLRPAERHMNTSHGSETAAVPTPKAIAPQVKVPLFLEDNLSSYQQLDAKARYEDQKQFTLDIDAFDIEESTLVATDFFPVGATDAHSEPPNATVEAHSSVCMDKDVAVALNDAQTAKEAEPIAELDEFAQGIAEFNAWLYSGAVEFTD